MSHGFHLTPCPRGRALPALLIAGGIAAFAFWPTVVAVAATVALIVKVALITLAGTAVLGITAVAVAAVRQRRQPAASVLTVRPAQPVEPTAGVTEQLAAFTAAVQRLERNQHAALPAPAHPVVIDQQALAVLLAGLARAAANDRQRELVGRWDAR